MSDTMSPFRRRDLAARRPKISKACNFCREHRVRCEASTPCPQCVTNKVACHRSRPSAPKKGNKRHTIGRENEASHEQLSGNEPWVHPTPTSDSQTTELSAQTPSPEENLAWTSHKTDSMLGFIARINAFCSESQLPDPAPSGGGPSIEQTTQPQAASCDLSYSQTKHLLRIFWSRFRPQMPIVELKDLTYNEQTAPSPLVDAVTAYSLHYIYDSGLNTRLVGLNWPQFRQAGSEVGMPYFQRCLSAVTQLAIFAVPSRSTMQCYCYLISYLLDAGQHQAAYNMVGLALRFSQTLNYMDSRTGGYRECQLFRRVWWTLIHLDFRCSRHVGKPVSVQVEELLCLRPTRELQDIHISNGLLYHTQSICLTSVALLMNEAVDRFSARQEARPDIEARAQNISDNLFHLQQWREEIRKEQSFAQLQFDTPINEQETTMDDGESSIETLLSTLLMLQYHNVTISLHRVFIQFPSHPLVPKSNPKADAHAATALDHAQIMIQIAHQRMAVHDNLYGLSEIHQYLWNAVITIVGFMLAYPFCYRCIRAREPLNLALEIFDANGENTTAKRAATLTRHLCDKVDMLVRNLNVGQAAPSAPSAGIPETSGQVGLPNQLSDFLWPTQGQDARLQDVSEEPLWSWADMINLDAWPTYCDEVSEAFMDPVDVSMLESAM